MNRSRTSLFEDALQVTAERIQRLKDSELKELMSDLLKAQAIRCGSPFDKLTINTEDKAADAGSDAWSEKPLTPDTWLGNEPTCWQFKAGVSGRPAGLRGEIEKEIPSETLRNGGRYVVVASASVNGKKGIEDRLNVLVEEANRLQLLTDKILVFGSEQLTLWCNSHPAIAARWAGYRHGVTRLIEWAADRIHAAKWHAAEEVQSKLKSARENLAFSTGDVRHLHIHGHAGVGKTRFALEICREACWRDAVVYIDQEDAVPLIDLINTAAQAVDIQLVIVADEVPQNRLLNLCTAVYRAQDRIRLITIGTCRSPDSTRIPEIDVPPLEASMAKSVVAVWYPAMPIEHIAFVTRFAAGYMRLLRLAADKVYLKPALTTNDLLV